MKYIASCSFGKDSTAMVLRLLEEGEPLDEVVFYNTGMEFDAVYNVRDMVIPELKSHGVQFTELKPERPFIYDMLARPIKKRNGDFVYGYGWCGGKCRWGTAIKRDIIGKYTKGSHVYVGIATDEPKRLERLTPDKSSPLTEWDMAEKDCLAYCYSKGIHWEENGVDLYEILDRVSCWCCSNKNKKELEAIYNYLPDYWAKLKALQIRISERPMKNYKNITYGEYGNLLTMEKIFNQRKRGEHQ